MRTLLKATALLGLLLAGCLVPTLDELDQEKARLCDAEHPCLPGYGCVEDRCQPEQGTACRSGAKADCGPDTGACQPGKRTCGEDGTYGSCDGAVPPTVEVCNGKDDDCDGTVDDGLSCGNPGDTCEPCTAAGRACVDGKCGGCLATHFEDGTQCQPKLGLGKSCTDGRTCGSGFCVDGVCCGAAACNTPPGQCYAATGTCASGACLYEPHPTTTTCDDGNKCTDADRCDGAGACAGNARVCNTSPGQCHQPTGTCEPSTGACLYAFKSDGTACNDSNACTTSESCDGAGSCGEGLVKLCNTPPDQCYQTAGTCNPSTGGCTYALKPSGSTCDDGMDCTRSDKCNNNGSCFGIEFCPADYSCGSDGSCTYDCGGGTICIR